MSPSVKNKTSEINDKVSQDKPGDLATRDARFAALRVNLISSSLSPYVLLTCS